MPIKRSLAAAVAAGLFLLLLFRYDGAADRADLRAATAEPLDLMGLVERAELCVRGTVVEAVGRSGADGVIETVYRLRVDERLIGSGSDIETFSLPGGVLEDGSGMVIPGLGSMGVGEEVLLFLTGSDQRTGRRMPVGLEQGRYKIVSGPDGRRLAIGGGARSEFEGDAPAVMGHARVLEFQELRARIEACLQRRPQESGR
jgi:hypothetical protein